MTARMNADAWRRFVMRIRLLVASLNGGEARRDAEWKHMVRVEAGRKSWATRRAREAAQKAERAENFELHDDRTDVVDVG